MRPNLVHMQVISMGYAEVPGDRAMFVSVATRQALPTAGEMERVLVEAVAREPDSELIERADWIQIRTPSSRRFNHNVVLRARVPAQDVDARVRAVAADHTRRGAAYRWVVGPSSHPGDAIIDALERGGASHSGRSLGMAMHTPSTALPAMAGLEVEAMRPETVDAYAELCARGFERTESSFAEALRYVGRRSFEGPPQTASFIATLHGEPVATSHLRLLPGLGLGYLQGCSVIPAYRGRGIYRALVYHRMEVLRERGVDRVVIWANASNAGIACGRLGFHTVCSADFYQCGGSSAGLGGE